MNFLVDERLNEKQLSRLKDHVYSSSGKSILDHKVDQRVHIDYFLLKSLILLMIKKLEFLREFFRMAIGIEACSLLGM